MADDKFYMREALAEARRAFDEGEIPIGAVVVCQGRIIARTHNLTERLTDVTAHAEMPECTLYVTVEPCPMCAGALGWAQIGRVVYGASDEKRGYRRFAPDVLHPRTEVAAGVLEEDCSALMKLFFQKKR